MMARFFVGELMGSVVVRPFDGQAVKTSENDLTFLFVAAHFATPLTCWLLNAFAWKRRLPWKRHFIVTCVLGYLVLMLAAASHVVSDALARQGVDAAVVFGEGEASDAGLALAPVLGIPITIVWTAVNFIALSVIEWCYRTDFRSFFSRNIQADRAVESEPMEGVDP